MKKTFKEIQPSKISDNTFKLIGSDWMLVTAGDLKSHNMMTASWGGLGVLWGKNVCLCVIRPSRHTYGFIEKASGFSISFFDERYREALEFCGSKSGRDFNKTAETGLTPVLGAGGTVYFDEARLVMECKKLYFQDLDPANFLVPEIEKNYAQKDYHRMYVGEIVKCYQKL